MLSCRIAQLRRSTGLNQSELAQKLYVSPSTIGMYEQGRRVPNLDILIQMSQIFNVSLDYLITGLEFLPTSKYTSRNTALPGCPCCRYHRTKLPDE